ncbi:MAG TPA: tyrosine-type recombinase/integrase [Paludibacter sp.]|mgnify:CR=1 FL=1|nr:tyrosine-type recombinase/integrase [Paludibacter sp.]
MKGSIQQKGKTYYAVIAINGKRKWLKGGRTKKDAQKVLNEKLQEIDNGNYKELPKISFGEFIKIWKRDYADISFKPSTKKSFYDIIDRLLNPVFSNFQINSIQTGQLQTYISGRAKEVMPNTVRNEVTVIKLIFKYAVRWGYIKNNPTENLDRPKIDKPEIEILSPAEFELFIEKVERPYKAAFLTAFLTGLRAGELWGLQWSSVDWTSKQIHVKQSLWRNEFQKPKTKNAMRKVDMTDRLVRELKKWKLACPISKDDLVFPSPEGCRTMHTNVMNRFFNPALRRAELRHVSFHSLRHGNVSMRIQAGQNIKYIQIQIGHASINMTLDVYGHLFNDFDFSRKQVELLESVRKPLENPLENPPKQKSASTQVIEFNMERATGLEPATSSLGS